MPGHREGGSRIGKSLCPDCGFFLASSASAPCPPSLIPLPNSFICIRAELLPASLPSSFCLCLRASSSSLPFAGSGLLFFSFLFLLFEVYPEPGSGWTGRRGESLSLPVSLTYCGDSEGAHPLQVSQKRHISRSCGLSRVGFSFDAYALESPVRRLVFRYSLCLLIGQAHISPLTAV